MNATISFMLRGIVPAGAILVGEMLAIFWIEFGPLWSLREHPSAVDGG
jgi:hypothetical protein